MFVVGILKLRDKSRKKAARWKERKEDRQFMNLALMTSHYSKSSRPNTAVHSLPAASYTPHSHPDTHSFFFFFPLLSFPPVTLIHILVLCLYFKNLLQPASLSLTLTLFLSFYLTPSLYSSPLCLSLNPLHSSWVTNLIGVQRGSSGKPDMKQKRHSLL